MSMQPRSIVAVVVAVLSFGVGTVGASLVSPWPLAVALAAGGVLLAFVSLAVIYVVFDDALPLGMPYDERARRIERHATRATLVVTMAVITTLLLSLLQYPGTVDATWLVTGLNFVVVATYGAAIDWYKRRL